MKNCPTSMLPRSAVRWWLFFFFMMLYVLTSSGRISGGDEGSMYQVTRNLVEHGQVSITERTLMIPAQPYPGFLPTRDYFIETAFASPGLYERDYSPYGLGQSLFAIPFYALGRGLGLLWPGVGPQFLARLCIQWLNALILAASSVLLVEFAWSLGFGLMTGIWLGLAFGFSTMVWPYVKTFYSEPGTTLCLLLAAYTLHRFRKTGRRQWVFWAGLSFGISLTFRVTALLAALPLGLYLVWILRERWSAKGLDTRAMAAGLLGCLPGLGIVLLYNWVRFGQLIAVGYTPNRIGWDTPFLNGAYGLLFSSGKGLFLYCPVLLLALGGILVFGQQHRGEALLVGSLFMMYIIGHASYTFWTGGWNWGPRFLVPVIPFMMLPIGSVLEKAKGRSASLLFALLAVLGFAAQVPAILVDHSRYIVEISERYERFYDKSIYQPELSPLMRQWPVALDVLRRFGRGETWAEARRVLTEHRATWLRTGVAEEDASTQLTWESEFLRNNVPDFWWVHLYLLGASPIITFGAALALAVAGVISALKVARLTRHGIDEAVIVS